MLPVSRKHLGISRRLSRAALQAIRSGLFSRAVPLTLQAIAVASLLVPSSHGAEREADQISAAIELRHTPGGIVMDPIYAGSASDLIVAYTHGGDAAIWTGHLLAAESLHYAVQPSAGTLRKIRRTVAAIGLLTDVTGIGLLARCAYRPDWLGAPAVSDEEAHHVVYSAQLGGEPWLWVGNTSRDQYLGVFFGLSLAYELVPDPALRGEITRIVTALLDYLRYHNWAVKMPGGETSTVFWHRPDQRLMLLQVGRQVNPSRFSGPYERQRFWQSGLVRAALAIDLVDEYSSYFKFNLNAITLYTLCRLEDGSTARKRYRRAWEDQWGLVGAHANAHFAAIDHAIRGADPVRDENARQWLDAWLRRPERDQFQDWSAAVPVCGSRACAPLPVENRIATDFLWQRSPFQLYGGGSGRVRGPGIDYLLPYWMLRYYGVLAPDPGRSWDPAALPTRTVVRE